MGFRFSKRITVVPGVRLNIGKRGISTTLGRRGASVTFGPQGTHANVGIPGTGVSYRTKINGNNSSDVETVKPLTLENFFKSILQILAFFVFLFSTFGTFMGYGMIEKGDFGEYFALLFFALVAVGSLYIVFKLK